MKCKFNIITQNKQTKKDNVSCLLLFINQIKNTKLIAILA